MKAFLWAVVFCLVVSVGAGLILTGQDDSQLASQTAEGVRVN
jgi:hypothetical protein